MCILLNWQIVHCILTCILFQLCTCSGLCQLLKVTLVIFFKKKKQNKKTKKRKNDPYFSMSKNTKSYATKNPSIYLFLGKGRESFVSNFIKTKLSALSALPSSMQTFSIQTQCGRRTPKFTPKLTKKNSFFLQILHLSSNRRVCNLTLYFQFTTPAREPTHRMKFEYPEWHEFWKHHVSSLP